MRAVLVVVGLLVATAAQAGPLTQRCMQEPSVKALDLRLTALYEKLIPNHPQKVSLSADETAKLVALEARLTAERSAAMQECKRLDGIPK